MMKLLGTIKPNMIKLHTSKCNDIPVEALLFDSNDGNETLISGTKVIQTSNYKHSNLIYGVQTKTYPSNHVLPTIFHERLNNFKLVSGLAPT